MPKRSVRISDKLDGRLQTAVKDGGFRTASDFIRTAVEKALKDDEDLLGMEERIAASCARITKDIHRVMRAQQALIAFVDTFVKTFLTCVPEPPAEIKAQQIEIAGPGPWLFPSSKSPTGYQTNFKKTWERTLRRAGVAYFRIYDLRSTHATRLSAGGVADEWVTQMLRQTDAKVFKKYSQMKLQMKREALARMNRKANEAQSKPGFDTEPAA